MNRHLTESEIAAMIEGLGSEAWRASLAEHLSSCPECLDTVAYAMRLSLVNVDTLLVSRALPPGTVSKLQAAYQEFIRKEREEVQSVLEMLPFRAEEAAEGCDEIPSMHEPSPLAAHGTPDSEQSLPALRSKDGRIVVRFAQDAGSRSVRAYLIARNDSTEGEAALIVSPDHLRFEFDSSGEASLEGITAEDLARSRIFVQFLE